jgi:hypothetical protein
MKEKVRRELDAIPLEAELGLHKNAAPQISTLNISHSTIANLNLGTVIGDLNGSIQTLGASGQSDAAEKIREITEAVSGSAEIPNGERKELLEHLALVAGEVALPPENRKSGPLKTSIAALKSGLSIAAQVLTLWHGLEPILRADGINFP